MLFDIPPDSDRIDNSYGYLIQKFMERTDPKFGPQEIKGGTDVLTKPFTENYRSSCGFSEGHRRKGG